MELEPTQQLAQQVADTQEAIQNAQTPQQVERLEADLHKQASDYYTLMGQTPPSMSYAELEALSARVEARDAERDTEASPREENSRMAQEQREWEKANTLDLAKTEQIDKLEAGIEKTEAWLQQHKELLAQCPGRPGDALSDLSDRQYVEVTSQFTQEITAAREDLKGLIDDREQSREANRQTFDGWEPPKADTIDRSATEAQRTQDWLNDYKESLREAPVRSGSELAGVLDKHFNDADNTARGIEQTRGQERDTGMER